MKLKVNGSILFLILQLSLISAGKVNFSNDGLRIDKNNLKLDRNYQNDQETVLQKSSSNQQIDKSEIRKRIEESNKYHLNINELEFDYFNMLTSRKKKSHLIKDNGFDYLKNQLIKPPYMYTNYHMSIEDQLNNDQSNDQQTNKEANNEFTNDHLDQLTLSDRSNLDQLNNDKTAHEELINNNITSNQTIDQQQQKKNWFVRFFSKLKLGWRLNSNVNLNATLNSTAIKEKLKYYEDYDVWMGIRIAYWLFSLFTIFTLFVAYKSYCSARKQARHRRESEKNRRKAVDNEQIGGSNRTTNVHLPSKLNSIKLKGVGETSSRETSSRMSNAFLKVSKASRELDSN